MSGTVNKVILIGNLGQDPEIRHFGNGGLVAKFSIATTENYLNKKTNELTKRIEWHTIVAWNKLGERVEKYLGQGVRVYVEGRLRTNSWTDKDGHTHNTTEIIADQLVILSYKNNTIQEAKTLTPYSSQGTPPAPSPLAIKNSSEEDDDLPF